MTHVEHADQRYNPCSNLYWYKIENAFRFLSPNQYENPNYNSQLKKL